MINLKSLPDATAQEVFDQGAMHLLVQDMKSYIDNPDDYSNNHEDNMCAYRNYDELKCGGGCFIGDDEYNPDWERKGWDMLVKEGLIPSDHSNLINELQHIHDNYDICRWSDKLIATASDFNLKPKVVYDFLTTHAKTHRRIT